YNLILRLHHLSSSDGFQQEFQNLHMTRSFGEVRAPGIEAVPPDQETVNLRGRIQHASDFRGKRFHVLTVFNNRYPLPVLMCFDAFQALEHFVTFKKETTGPNVIIRKYRTPHRMRVQDCPGSYSADDREMQQRFGGWFAL